MESVPAFSAHVLAECRVDPVNLLALTRTLGPDEASIESISPTLRHFICLLRVAETEDTVLKSLRVDMRVRQQEMPLIVSCAFRFHPRLRASATFENRLTHFMSDTRQAHFGLLVNDIVFASASNGRALSTLRRFAKSRFLYRFLFRQLHDGRAIDWTSLDVHQQDLTTLLMFDPANAV
jgi:hypothetical protein